MLRAGTFLQDRYEILEPIGSGGMSVVYKARCHKLNRLVAVKVLKEEFRKDAGFVSRFKMEAQAAAGLSHPNIVNVYDVVDEGELHYIVMELIEGITLKNHIAKKGHLEVNETIGIAIQVAQGIAAAHDQRIVHRDIKPQNMIISKDGKVKVADFGIARAVSAQTLGSNVMGSVHYISPEQARGGYSDARSDIYSLGITMYEMVTGQVPFGGENTVTVALAHLEEQITPPSAINQDTPASLERIILKCTEKKPENRYESVNMVISDLRRSLLSSDSDIVRDAQRGKTLGETVMMNDAEMAKIKEHKRLAQGFDKPVHRVAEYQPETKQKRIAGSAVKKKEEDDGVNKQIERIMTITGIAVAIVIVAVLLYVFSRLGGMFQKGSLVASLPSIQTEGTVPESELSVTQVYMPDVLDLREDMAEAKLKASDLSMKQSYEYSDTVEAGFVISQSPDAGEVVSKWSSVSVVISNGSDKIDLAALNLGQMDAQLAKSLLESRSLTVNLLEQSSDTIDSGKVISFAPEKAAQGGVVTLYVSTGPEIALVPIPVITGLEETDAIALLSESGLIPGTITTEYSETVKEGYIISQSGGENGSIEPGGSISYVVSLGLQASTVRYLASINTTYEFSSLIGPGSSSANVKLLIRLHQIVDGADVYTTLMEPRTMRGDTLLPIQYSSIEGAAGLEAGLLEVVEADSGAVLKTYPLTFFPMN